MLKGSLIGLDHAHSLGLVHRDLKPDNVIADREGVSKLADFGQSAFTPGPGAAGGVANGATEYLSPEQVSGGRIDYRSDIYSAGAMLFEFLTGQTPLAGGDPRATNSEVPRGVAEMVMRAMTRDPSDRQQTALQFLDDLEQAAIASYGEGGRETIVDQRPGGLGDRGRRGAAGRRGRSHRRSSSGSAATARVGASGVGAWWTVAGTEGPALIAGILILVGSGAIVQPGVTHAGQAAGEVAAVSTSTGPIWSDSPSPNPEPSPSQSLAQSLAPGPSPTPGPNLGPSLGPSLALREDPRPSRGPRPSPSQPSPVSTPPAPPPASAGPVTVVGAAVWYRMYMPVAQAYESSPTLYDSASGPLQVSCAAGTVPLHLFEDYTLQYPGSGANEATNVKWSGQSPSGIARGPPMPATPRRPAHTPATPSASTEPGYADGEMAAAALGASGSIGFTVSWTNPDGSAGTSSAVLNYVCS